MKKIASIMTTLAALLLAGTFGLVAAPNAAAGNRDVTFGQSRELVDANGTVVTSLTVTGLKQSNDRVDNVQLAGKLYEATATIKAVKGTVTPAIPFFNARSANNENYRVLFQAFTTQGVNPSNILQGGEATGKIYFDVTGPAPTKVAYDNGVEDLVVWS